MTDARPSVLDHLLIVLVEPGTPGNVGSVCRVMKNTGLQHLVVVRPKRSILADEARWMAHGSTDLLESATIVDDLDAAIADCHLVIGTTHRDGRFRVVYDDYPSVVGQAVSAATHGHRVALLFGREKDGLSRDELMRCHHLVRIPSAVPHPSFNLSHAVLIIAYEFFRQAGKRQSSSDQRLVTAAEMDQLIGRVMEAMGLVEFRPFNENTGNFERVLRRFFNRAPLERRDAYVVHRICGQIRKFVARHLNRGQEGASERGTSQR